jgi:hypothetical protein
MWAILSGIEGNLAAYQAVLRDIRRQRPTVESLYILGDVIGLHPQNEQVLACLQSPQPGELQPQVCQGWWEEQLLILYGLGRTGEPTELIERYGKKEVKTLWDSVPRSWVEWLRQLDFGLFALDCLMIHGSTVGVSDELTPDTSPIKLLDRLMRMESNTLFCGRSGLTFEYEIQAGTLPTTVQRLDQPSMTQTATLGSRRVVGVGNVGHHPGLATYTLYAPNTNQVKFRTVSYGLEKGFKRFQA